MKKPYMQVFSPPQVCAQAQTWNALKRCAGMESRMMSLEQMEGIIEAVLFTMGDSVEAGKLADAIEQDVDTTVKIVHNLMDKYESENRGIRIIGA